MTRVALDAMGGDNAPGEIVRGGVEAAVGLDDIKVILVGVQEQIDAELAKYPKDVEKARKAGKLEVVAASEILEMEDEPAKSVRAKKDCSINVAMRLVKDGKADAFVSAGNSGAVSASAIFNLGRIKGVHRPAIATVLPTQRPIRPTLLLDAGANMDCHPDWLVQFAIMGSAYSKAVLKRTKPLVGLLSIGTEDCKGNEMTKETFKLLKDVKSIDFRGNVEGHDIFHGQTDVIVCDGFVGNSVLKTAESLVHAIKYFLKKECFKGVSRIMGAILLKGAFKALKQHLDPDILGGAPLLGVQGAVIITHGSSNHKAIYHSVRVGGNAARNDVTGLIAKQIAEYEESRKAF